MNNIDEILEIINDIPQPTEGYNFIEKDNVLWGKGVETECAFGIRATSNNDCPITQTTKFLKVFINTKFKISINGSENDEKISIYVLKTKDLKHRETFVRLAVSMSDSLNDAIMFKNFLELKDLFANSKKASKIELQGMYGELFSMYFLKVNYGLDISCFYQKEEKRKFDFSLSETKKIEIKTTTKPERIHHFLHQQLDTDRYDIKIISIMLQKDDCGMSLLELVNECMDLFSNYLNVVLYIETYIKNLDNTDLDEIRFSIEYAKDNIRLFSAHDVPKLKEKNVEGVYNIEYDVDFTNVSPLSKNKFIDWATKNRR